MPSLSNTSSEGSARLSPSRSRLTKPIDLRVISRPAFDNRREDPGNYYLFHCIRSLGVTVSEGRGLRLLFGNFHLVHFHWPDNVLRSTLWLNAALKVVGFALLIALMRVRRKKIV